MMKDDVQAVLTFPRAAIAGCPRFMPWDRVDVVMRTAEENMAWVPRPRAEESEDIVQFIPCALVRGENQEYHVFRRVKAGRADLSSRISLVVGGHIDPMPGIEDLASLVLGTLRGEISEELGISAPARMKPIGLVVDSSSIEASRHIGLVHEFVTTAQIKPRATEEFSVRSKFVGQPYQRSQLSGLRKSFDPWSTFLFADYIDPTYALDVGQQPELLPRRNAAPGRLQRLA